MPRLLVVRRDSWHLQQGRWLLAKPVLVKIRRREINYPTPARRLQAAGEHLRDIDEGPALDAVLIGGIQKVEHCCIAAWGTARSLAQATGQRTTARAMEITPALLSEESEDEEGTEEQSEQTHAKKAPSRSSRSAPRH